MRKTLLVIFGILVIFLVGVFIIGYFYPKELKEKITIPLELEQEITPALPPPKIRGAGGETVSTITSAEEISELCAKYKSFEATTSCEQVAAIVLAKYPGNIFSIEKTQINMPLPPGKGKTSELIDVWSVIIQLENPIELLGLPLRAETDKLEVMLDIYSGEVKTLKSLHTILK